MDRTRHDQEYEDDGPGKQRPTGKARTRTPPPRRIGSCLPAKDRTCVSVRKDSCEPCVEEPPRDGKGGDRQRIFFKIEELQMHLQPQLLFPPWTNGLQMHVQPQLLAGMDQRAADASTAVLLVEARAPGALGDTDAEIFEVGATTHCERKTWRSPERISSQRGDGSGIMSHRMSHDMRVGPPKKLRHG
eukprot:scaffold179_cov373-Pavlova_lutheri.AAC.7